MTTPHGSSNIFCWIHLKPLQARNTAGLFSFQLLSFRIVNGQF